MDVLTFTTPSLLPTRAATTSAVCTPRIPCRTPARPRRACCGAIARTVGVGPSKREQCVLVGVDITTRSALRGETRLFSMNDSLAELTRLADTAGLEVVGVLTQTLATPVSGTYIGSGKVREVQTELNATGACTVVFDLELSPSQQRTLETSFGGEKAGIKVLDRTAVILDIFAQRARSREGHLQVELALYQYRQSRLTRMWTHLERQAAGAGVGLRGPGETQIEVDRRAVAARISRLRRELAAVQTHRERQRAARREHVPLPVVALVGYTNAGKSTLLNSLAGEGAALVEDRLFATVDPKTRRAIMPGVKLSPEMLVTDTVGFVQNLPTQLLAAFRATLEEVVAADALVHVVDATAGAELAVAQMKAVADVLQDIGASGKPGVVVLNKVDAVDPKDIDEVREAVIQAADGVNVVDVVARTGHGVADLGRLLDDVLRDVFVAVCCVVPYERGELVNMVYEQGSVDFEEFVDTGTKLEACVPRALAKRLEPYREIGEKITVGNDREESDAYWSRLARKRQSH